jgi:ribose 5-phosphate isomerase
MLNRKTKMVYKMDRYDGDDLAAKVRIVVPEDADIGEALDLWIDYMAACGYSREGVEREIGHGAAVVDEKAVSNCSRYHVTLADGIKIRWNDEP